MLVIDGESKGQNFSINHVDIEHLHILNKDTLSKKMHADFKDLVQKYLKFSINKLHIGYILT